MNHKSASYHRFSLLWLTGLLLITAVSYSCDNSSIPKPRGYFRIDLPEKSYRTYQSECSYSFEYPEYGKIVPYAGADAEPCWINLEFPEYKGTVHLTYKKLNNNLAAHIEDIRLLAYKHIIKADDIIEKPFYFPERDVFGMVYDIRGNTASSINFFITDSTSNFLSGALYFNVQPNKDSLAPVIDFFTADIEHLIDTFSWN
ncbi:MAG: gliding motility lipoprotein GldD [Bacteroidales bacterium]|nr:gliding motility lipoprotein GldD [Bacteroidales bacterium]